MNPTKCVVMRFGDRASRVVQGVGSGYRALGEDFRLVNLHRDLGVTVDCQLKFHIHVGVIVNKASLVNQLLRSTVCRSHELMVTLFVSHVRPLLDYCSIVWNLGYLGDVKRLEAV